MAWNYGTLVEERCTRNPSLQSLHNFLSTPQPCGSNLERIVSVDVFRGENSKIPHSVQREVSPSLLANELRDDERLPEGDGEMLGQILLIENISQEAICTLGANLSIDPMFFASHLHSAWREVDSQSPKFCQLPSQTKQQNFATFFYHKSLLFPDLENQDCKLVPKSSNVRRKVVVFPGEKGRRVGLAQHCCSVFVGRNRETKGWLGKCLRDHCTSVSSTTYLTFTFYILGLVLVDPPTKDEFVSLRSDEQEVPVRTPNNPLFGRTEDFERTTDGNKPTRLSGSPIAGQSMLTDLLESWQTLPEGFTPHTLTIRALSYYALRLVAAEWVSYISLMCFCLRQYDSPPSPGGAPASGTRTAAASTSKDLDRINCSLVSISSWPRRVNSSTISLRKCTTFIKHHAGHSEALDSARGQWEALQDDYEHLTHSLIQQGKQLEAAVPLVTAYLQLAESRRANLETKDVSRLTILAFVFVPLSFVSGLFSMNPDIGPGGSHFWLYFVVALPVVVLVLLVARPLTWNRLYAWLKRVLVYLRRCGSSCLS